MSEEPVLTPILIITSLAIWWLARRIWQAQTELDDALYDWADEPPPDTPYDQDELEADQ